MVFPVQVSLGIYCNHLVKAYLFLPHVEKLTIPHILVRYYRPADFNGGQTEFRAASGPVTITCVAIGAGSGTINYQWSSTCRSCPFKSATSSAITRDAVDSGDTGTHTCEATRGGGIARFSFNFNVVGESRHLNY